MKKIIIQSPTRVDLAGGTLDLWPLYNFVGGACTVNVAIDIFTTVEIEETKDGSIELISDDLGLQKKFKNLDECLADTDQQLHLLQIQLSYWRPQKGFRLHTKSDSPVGAGLGGSSSLTVGLLKAFDRFTHAGKNHFASVAELVNVAHNLEAQVLNSPTGTQDYYPAASGGINILRYSANGAQQEVLPISGAAIEKHFLLVYTGKSHHSGINNFEVLTRAVNRDEDVLKALSEIKELAAQTAEICRTAHYSLLPAIFEKEYAARIRLAESFSSPEIEKLREVCLRAGADAVKICGAGGGGCVLVWVNPNQRQEVVTACEKNGFKVLPAKPVAPLALHPN
jgi:D-glycero-alpha-D-manno-heptose-7-phosphate kinase